MTARDVFDDDLVQERYFDDMDEYDARDYQDDEYDARDYLDDEYDARDYLDDEYDARDFEDEEELSARVINPALLRLARNGGRRALPPAFGRIANRIPKALGGVLPRPRIPSGLIRKIPGFLKGRKNLGQALATRELLEEILDARGKFGMGGLKRKGGKKFRKAIGGKRRRNKKKKMMAGGEGVPSPAGEVAGAPAPDAAAAPVA